MSYVVEIAGSGESCDGDFGEAFERYKHYTIDFIAAPGDRQPKSTRTIPPVTRGRGPDLRGGVMDKNSSQAPNNITAPSDGYSSAEAGTAKRQFAKWNHLASKSPDPAISITQDTRLPRTKKYKTDKIPHLKIY